MKKYWQFSPGFTLIELLVVISIMAILTVALLATFNPGGQLKRGRDAQRKGNLSQIRMALETYRADKASYLTTASFSAFACGNAFTSGGSTYMQKVPCDPLNRDEFVYQYSGSSTQYCLRACLENTNDSQKDSTNDPVITGCNFSASCSSGWSYTVQNP